MKRFFFILLSVEFLVAVVLGQIGVWHRRDFDRAYFAWHENPTLESRAELDRQKHINVLYDLGFSGVLFGGMAVATLLPVYAFSRRYRNTPT